MFCLIFFKGKLEFSLSQRPSKENVGKMLEVCLKTLQMKEGDCYGKCQKCEEEKKKEKESN